MTSRSTTVLVALATALLSGSALAQTPQQNNAQPTVMDRVVGTVQSLTGSPMATLDTDMRHVIDALNDLGPKDVSKLSAAEARQQPGAADAAKQVLRGQGKSTLPDPAVTMKNVLVDGAKGKIVATTFTPAAASGPLPVIVYYHGGGFVIANNATYADSAAILAKEVGAVVVAVEYSKAPEHKFPASHDDAIAAYKWIAQNAGSLGGDPAKIAIAGESAGGNLTVNVAIAARDQNLPKPAHLLIVYPMAGADLETESYKENTGSKPLNKPMMEWFYSNLTNSPADMQDPRIDIVGKANLGGLPPSTVITAQIDPLRSEGQALAAKLKGAGVNVDVQHYDGVTHEFFSMGMVVADAKAAETVAVKNLKAALGK